MNDLPAPSDPAPACGLRERKKQATRLAMHRAALELVAEGGLGTVTAERIAQRAGVSTRTFFNHWPTKEAAILGIHAEEREAVTVGLREALEAGTPPREAVRAVLRRAIASVPSDPELRRLKKQVMAREERLQSISTGNTMETQIDMVDVLEQALTGPEARERAIIAIQLGFALTRSAFTISMRRGTDVVEAFDHVVALYDSGEVLP